MYQKEKDFNGAGMQKELTDLLMAAAEAREYAQSLKESTNPFCGRCWTFNQLKEKRQLVVVVEAWTRAKRSGFVQSSDARGRGPFLPAVRPTTNLMDGNRPFAEVEGGKDHGPEATNAMIRSLRNFINKDNVKAFMSIGGTRKRAFNASVARVNQTSPDLEGVDNSAHLLKGHDAGSVNTWYIRLTRTHTEISMKEPEWIIR